MYYFSLVCAAYLLLKENNVNINKQLRRITIATGLKKLYITVVAKGKPLAYESSIDVIRLTRFDFYTLLKCIITNSGNIQTLNKTQSLILQTIERINSKPH